MSLFPLSEDYEVIASEELSHDLNQAIESLSHRAGLKIPIDRDLNAVVVGEQGTPVAALWTSWRSDRFAFDVVVDSQARGKGLAKYLVQHAICAFNEDRKAYDDALMVIDVVNPIMKQLLEDHFGFSVGFRRGPKRWEMIPTFGESGEVVIAPSENVCEEFVE
ncbi:MAG TPA: GNAT family N-acetyltransferase [Clostridia bacterium]|nr:GNAT family N-acetyltransferase [Clostridia bacterium]